MPEHQFCRLTGKRKAGVSAVAKTRLISRLCPKHGTVALHVSFTTMTSNEALLKKIQRQTGADPNTFKNILSIMKQRTMPEPLVLDRATAKEEPRTQQNEAAVAATAAAKAANIAEIIQHVAHIPVDGEDWQEAMDADMTAGMTD